MVRNVMAVSAAAMAVALAMPALADEGMWTFDAFPAARMKAAYGWSPDQAWLDKARASAVRLTGGCSASFVSDQGLILTNHHCVESCLQEVSTPQNDYIANGFVSANRGEEKKCPGQQAEVVTMISDVTGKVKGAIGGATGADLVKARDAEIARIESSECTDKEKTRCQVVTLFGGGQYKLYQYRKYSDVRIAWAPEFAAAFFGGDPDNFNFPRYALDAAFLRAYENGQPAATPAHLKWEARAPKEGEAVFVIGNPGRTQRLFTQDQLALLRTTLLPFRVAMLSEYRGQLIATMKGSPERTREGNSELFGVENSYKVIVGQNRALNDADFSARLAANETDLKTRVAADPALAARVGNPWAEIARADTAYRNMFYEFYFLENGAGFGSSLYGYAKALVRAADERKKPNGERLPAYTESNLPLLEKQILDEAPVYPWLEQLQISFWLTKAREYLTADHADTRLLLGRDAPDQIAQTLVGGTKLADAAYRKSLWEGGAEAIARSTDPMIVYVRERDARARALRAHYDRVYDGPVTVAQSQLSAARFGAYGDTLYPDATFTLRISYGKVQGWAERGSPVPYMTTMGGTYDRATGQEPFRLAKAFEAHRGHVNPDLAYDFVTTNDIIGGNSGSPAVSRDLAVIGAAFDGNIHSIGGNFGYDPALNRTVIVSTAAIQEALTKLYPAPALARELNGR